MDPAFDSLRSGQSSRSRFACRICRRVMSYLLSILALSPTPPLRREMTDVITDSPQLSHTSTESNCVIKSLAISEPMSYRKVLVGCRSQGRTPELVVTSCTGSCSLRMGACSIDAPRVTARCLSPRQHNGEFGVFVPPVVGGNRFLNVAVVVVQQLT